MSSMRRRAAPPPKVARKGFIVDNANAITQVSESLQQRLVLRPENTADFERSKECDYAGMDRPIAL